MSKIRNEYALLQKENNQLKIQLQKYQNYVENLPQKSHTKYKKPIRKRKHYYYDDQEESEDSDSYVTEIRRIRPNKQRKRVIYEDEIDRLPEYEPHSLTEDEEQEREQDNYKIQTKSKKRPPKQIKKSRQPRKGITKSIRM